MLIDAIRSPSHEEISQIVDMIRAAANEGAFFPWLISTSEHRRKFQKYAFDDPQEGYKLQVYQRNKEVVGYIDTCIRRGVGQILGIYVKPNHRRQGIGRKLMNHALTNFIERGCHKAQVKVFKENIYAINFYRQTHFRLEATLCRDEAKKDILVMSQFLN